MGRGRKVWLALTSSYILKMDAGPLTCFSRSSLSLQRGLMIDRTEVTSSSLPRILFGLLLITVPHPQTQRQCDVPELGDRSLRPLTIEFPPNSVRESVQ